MRKIIRILLSPVVFVFAFGVMVIFPGTLFLIMGLSSAVYYQLIDMGKQERKEKTREALGMSTMLFWYPCLATWEWIVDGKITGI